jgi:hypothetical protein
MLPPSRHRQRTDATAEANITAANSNEQIAASIAELRRELASKEPEPETPAEHHEVLASTFISLSLDELMLR